MAEKSINEWFKLIGFSNTINSFHRLYRNGFIIVKCPESLKSKKTRMLERYIREGKIEIIAKNQNGENINAFIGFEQMIQKFRKKEYHKFVPSRLYDKEVNKIDRFNWGIEK